MKIEIVVEMYVSDPTAYTNDLEEKAARLVAGMSGGSSPILSIGGVREDVRVLSFKVSEDA